MKRLFAVLVAVFALAPTSALAAPGDLDTTFSGDGVARLSLMGSSRQVIVDSLNRVYVGGEVAFGKPFAGSAVVVRYKANGVLDSTFSGDGKVYLASLGPVLGLELTSGNLLALTRDRLFSIKPSGAPNNAFDLDGQIVVHRSRDANDGTDPLAVGPDGLIYVLHECPRCDHYRLSFVDQYSSNGRWLRDYSFDNLSLQALSVHGQTLYAAGVSADPTQTETRAALTSLTLPSLTLNTSFGGGTVYHSIDQNGAHYESWPYDVLVAPGSLKVTIVGEWYNCPAGQSCSVGGFFPWAMRFLPDGSPDTYFNGTGEYRPYAGTPFVAGAMQSSGRVVVTTPGHGDYGDGADYGFFVDRLTATGQLDPGFRAPDLRLPNMFAEDVALSHRLSRIVVVGTQYVARYLG